MARLEVTPSSTKTISYSRHIGRWMKMAWGICDKSQNDIWAEGMKAVFQVFGTSTGVSNNPQIDEWARRPNGTLCVETMKPTFRSLIFGTAELKRIPQQVLQAASTYIPCLNLCQLLHMRMHGNATHMREGWVGHDWTECQISSIRDFAAKVEDTICELLVEAMLKQGSTNDSSGAQQALDEASRFTLRQRRFMGRKAILHAGVAACYESSLGEGSITNSSLGLFDKKRLPSPSWWFIFGGVKPPEDDEEAVAGFYFQWRTLNGFSRRPDGELVFCLASTKSRDPTMPVPWHILQLPIDESIVRLITCSLDFVGSAAPGQQPKSYRTLAKKSIDDGEDTTGEYSTEADTPSPVESSLCTEKAARHETSTNEGEESWEMTEAEIEANGLAPIWDEGACEAWEKGQVLFYDTIKEHFVYYGYRCWLDEENEALYYWDDSSASYAYLNEDLHNSIAAGLIPCFPELIETDEPQVEETTELSKDGITTDYSVDGAQLKESESTVAADEVIQLSGGQKSDPDSMPAVARIDVSEAGPSEANVNAKVLIDEAGLSLMTNKGTRGKSYTKGSIPEAFRQLHPVSGFLPASGPHSKEDSKPLCKAAPKLCPQIHPKASTTNRSLQVQVIDFFRATDSSLFKQGVDFLQRVLHAHDCLELSRWECRRDGSIKVGKQKKQIEGLMTGVADAKSISPVDLSLITGSLNLLNFQQILMIRYHGSSTGAWDRASAEYMKQFALKVDMMLSERLAQFLADSTKIRYSPEDTSEGQVEKFDELSASDKRYAGGQILFLLGSFMSASRLRDLVLRSPPASDILDLCLSDLTQKTESWWFVPCHPIAGATLPRGPIETKPTGIFLGYPSLRVQILRPTESIYRLVRAQTTNIGGNNGWEIALMENSSTD